MVVASRGVMPLYGGKHGGITKYAMISYVCMQSNLKAQRNMHDPFLTMTLARRGSQTNSAVLQAFRVYFYFNAGRSFHFPHQLPVLTWEVSELVY